MGMQGRNAEPGQWLLSWLCRMHILPHMSPRSALTTDTSCYVRLQTLVVDRSMLVILYDLCAPWSNSTKPSLYV
jgi:hypothetical protein